MLVSSKYTKTFVSNDLTRQKYDELYLLASTIREHKNAISKEIASDILHYIDINPLVFVTEMRNKHKGEIGSNFDKHLYQEVIDAYQNKFDAIKKKVTFEQVTFQGFEFYQRNCKGHSKGDFKRVLTKRNKTQLSICLTYLARYGNENTIEYINKQLKTCDAKKVDFYKNIIRCCDKFGFNRLLNLAIRKRDRVLRKYAEPIVFKSLSFRGRSRKKYIVEYNKNYNSRINAFISLSFPTRKSMDVPVKFSEEYHGNMNDYANKTNDYEYVVCFDEKRKQVKINIVKNEMRYIPTVTKDDTCVGIDVNVKHNLFCLSNGKTYDYCHKLVDDYCRLKRHIDSLKSKNENYSVGKRMQKKLDTLRNKILKRNQELISKMCKDLMYDGVRHIVMENLDNGFGKSYVRDSDLDNVNFNDKVKFLGISSLKQEVEHIGRKYDIALSTVQSSYTSKMCSKCGCVDDGNRKTQECFCCVECGNVDNADKNAAINIKNRVGITVLCNKLLKQTDNGTYKPLKLSKEKVKCVLLSYRSNNLTIVENL